MNLVFLGSGNTATALCRLIVQKGHTILQVWSRNNAHAQQLAEQVNADVLTDLKQIHPAAEICVLAVTDDAVAEVASQLSLQKKIVVHTAGSVSREVLKVSSSNYGVLYPLQSLRKETSISVEIPFLVDGNSDDTEVFLFDFAQTLSKQVHRASDEERLKMHVAAVVVNNFTNHLYAVAQDFCNREHLDFKLLHPLIFETAMRLQQGNAYDLQTGPAKRGDEQTVQKHLELLGSHEPLQKLYQTISNSIAEMYDKNNELREI